MKKDKEVVLRQPEWIKLVKDILNDNRKGHKHADI